MYFQLHEAKEYLEVAISWQEVHT